MRATLIVLLLAMSMIPLGTILNPQAQAENISLETKLFNNGKTEAIVDFQGGGIDTNYGLTVQTGVYIEDVRMKLSSVAQPSGSKDYPSNIAIDFGGDRALEWTWQGPGFGPLGRQTMFVNNRPYMNATVTMGGGYNDSTAFRIPKTAVVKSAVMNVSAGKSIGQQGKILIMPAVYTNYGWDTDPVNKMKAFTKDFSVVDKYDARSNTPTWDDIKDYSAILVYTDGYYGYGFRDSAAMGDLLANYVDAGGSVVCAWWTFLASNPYQITGRFKSEEYYVISPSNSYTSSSSGVGKIDIPNHPVMANVSSINFPYWGYTYRCYNPSVTTGSSIISHWSDGYIMAATKSVGGVDRVDINMWPVSYQASGSYGSYGTISYNGDGDDLIKNALLFGGRKPIDAAVDIFNDGTAEFSRNGFSGNYTFPDFSSALNQYIATAEVSYEDKYGNRFVDVPINVSSPKGGRVSLDTLAVTYDYTTSVDVNPATGNLTMGVSEVQSTVVGEEMLNIPIFVSSASSGKLRFHDLYVRMTPPQHKPRVDSYFPALDAYIPEATTLEMIVNATDIYRNPMTYTWFHNGERLPGSASNRLSLDFGFEDAGIHTVVVKIANGITEKTYTNLTWNLRVVDVNRPPSIGSFLPTADVTMNENAAQRFEVVATDPDPGDTLSHRWFVDGKQQAGADGDNYTYAPGYFDSGTHTVKAIVADQKGADDYKTWQVVVVDVNVAPLIQSWTPKEDPTIIEGQNVAFAVSASDIDRDDRVTISWYVDDVQMFVGDQFTYDSDFRSAGVHMVKVTASDGDAQDQHIWKLSVENLNRLPQAAIESPTDQAEFVEGQAIKFSARFSTDPDNETLSFSWKEGGVNVSDQVDFERAFPPGLHTLTVWVADRSGGLASATVHFRVRYTEIATAIGLDTFDVQAGNKVSIVLTMSNVGDLNATEVPVELLVDGKSMGTTTVKEIGAGGVEKAVFQWKATRGPHTITAKIGEQTWTKEIAVAAAPAPPPGVGIADYLWAIILVVIAVGLVAFGFMVLKKK